MEGPWAQLAIALGLGLLVGLQREWSDHPAGIRTFALITLLGALAALVGGEHGSWVFAAGLVAVAGAMVVMMYLRGTRGSGEHPELTSVVAALVMYLVGAMVVLDHAAPAIAVAGATAVLLQWKKPLHGFVARIGEPEIRAVFRLVLIALVILPLLPDRTYGPYDVLNPHRVWLMVVLIVGISVASYMLHHFLGRRASVVLDGVLGGLVSSTATTVSWSRRSKLAPHTAGGAAAVVLIASTLAFVRVSIEVVIVAPMLAFDVLPPLLLVAVVMAAMSVLAWLRARTLQTETPPVGDPTDLRVAIAFGALYAAILLGVAAAEAHFDDLGMFLVAALSGLTEVDAVTLSTAEIMKSGRIDVAVGWRMMLIASLANVAFKGIAVAVLGPRALLRPVALMFAVVIASGVATLLLWPA